MSVVRLPDKRATKDGRAWVFRIYQTRTDGSKYRYTSKAYKTKEEAEQAEKDYINKYQYSGDIPHMTFKEASIRFVEYKKDKVRRTTLKTYRERMRFMGILNDIELVNLSLDDYQKWRAEINKQDLRSTYKNDIQKFIKMVINYAEKNYNFNLRKFYLHLEPFKDPNEVEHEKRFYTPEEFYKFISVIDDLQMKCLFKTLYECGLRRSEARGITWDRIDFNNHKLIINRQVISKTARSDGTDWMFGPTKTPKSNRVLPLSNDLYNDLKLLYNKMSNEQGFTNDWFVFGNSEPITPYKMFYQNEKAAKAAGVKLINLHGFRHSCASNLINNQVNISVVSHYLGHADIEETLNTYTHMFENKLNEVADFINEQSIQYSKKYAK